MEQLAENSWKSIFLNFIILGLIIFLVYRLAAFVLPRLFTEKRYKNLIKILLPGIETVSWFLFISWYIIRFSAAGQWYALVLVALLLILAFWLSRFYIRDLIAGMIFRLSGKFKEGDRMQSGEIEGRIIKMGNLTLELEGPDGNLIFTPYSVLSEAVKIKTESSEQITGHAFRITCDTKKPVNEKMDEIQAYILTLPWVSLKKQTQIKLINQDAEKYNFEISIYLIDKAFAQNAEKLIRAKFSVF